MKFPSIAPEDALGFLNEVERKHAPALLYYRGDIGLLQERPIVSIVGSRKASEMGLRRAAALAKHLCKKNVCILSGLAEGIDSIAHTTAIENKGKTIAVIGTPLDIAYPAIHKNLQNRIAEDYLVLSQYESGTRVYQSNFPMRNRTMALISNATVIVEAQEKSGTLHQGWEALRLGRPLYLLESILENDDLKWPAEMLKYGAQILSRHNLEEVIDSLPRMSRKQLYDLAI